MTINQTKAKKRFIKWFLDRYELKNKEAQWLLEYIRTNEKALERTHFVENFRNLPKVILISTKDSYMSHFKFYKNSRVTQDVEKAFMDIKNNPDEDIYIGLFFTDRQMCPEFIEVLEDNPNIPNEIDPEIKEYADFIIKEAEQKYIIDSIMKEIDEALDNKNESKFYELSKVLCEIVE